MTLKDYLEQERRMVGEKSFAGALLRKGRRYGPEELTKDERQVVLASAKLYRHDFKLKQCFFNSQMLVLYDRTNQLQYVEGYASKIFPVLHAWVTINDKVIDLTWRHEGKESRRFEKRIWGDNFDWEYYGMVIDKKYIREAFENGCAKSFLDDPENGWPLLQESA